MKLHSNLIFDLGGEANLDSNWYKNNKENRRNQKEKITGTYYDGCVYTETQRICLCGGREVVLLGDYLTDNAKELVKMGKKD